MRAVPVQKWMLIVALVLHAGCGPRATEGTSGETTSDPAQGFEVVDGAGRTVAFEQAPQRIVVAGHATFIVLHTLCLFPEGLPRLVGVEQRGTTVSAFLPLVEPGFPGDRTVLGMGAGPEHIAAARPDVVLMKYTADTRLADSLEQVGIPVVYLGLEDPEQFERDVTSLGQMLQNEERAQVILDFYEDRVDRVKRGVDGVQERPSVLVADYRGRGGSVAMQVPAQPWMQTTHVRLAGGSPVWLDAAERTYGWTVVNLEQIAVWDPQRIIVVVPYPKDPAEVLAALLEDPVWAQLRAVRDGNLSLYPTDLYGWDSPEPRWILGLLWMARTLHPEQFEDLDISAEAVTFFQEMYGIDPAVTEAELLSKVNLDDR
jgi:iron complex transport system substrate-binding protein